MALPSRYKPMLWAGYWAKVSDYHPEDGNLDSWAGYIEPEGCGHLGRTLTDD